VAWCSWRGGEEGDGDSNVTEKRRGVDDFYRARVAGRREVGEGTWWLMAVDFKAPILCN
jgi:hypothetical protein